MFHLPPDPHPAMRRASQFHRPDIIKDPLYVIVPIFNPERFRTRWKHYNNFETHILNAGAYLVTIEAAFGDRAFVFTEPANENHIIINLRTSQEIWLKENMINLAIQRLPHNWKYVAWIDGDISFARPDIVGETLQQLQHYHVVQMFTEAHDMDYEWECIKKHKGFAWSYINSDDKTVPPNQGKKIAMPLDSYGTNPFGEGISYWHPGFAWAARREAIDSLGGLIDWGILGGGDTFMAYALIGMLDHRTMPNSLGATGVRWLKEWQDRSERYVRRNVGFVSGTIYHHWHGSRKKRAYWDRGTILTKGKYDPEKDLKKDWQGLYAISPENILLRDGARKYFRNRLEDSII